MAKTQHRNLPDRFLHPLQRKSNRVMSQARKLRTKAGRLHFKGNQEEFRKMSLRAGKSFIRAMNFQRQAMGIEEPFGEED